MCRGRGEENRMVQIVGKDHHVNKVCGLKD